MNGKDVTKDQREHQSPTDLRDERAGAYDAINEAGKPPSQTPPTDAQVMQGIYSRETGPVSEQPLPEGLRRSRKSPHNPKGSPRR